MLSNSQEERTNSYRVYFSRLRSWTYSVVTPDEGGRVGQLFDWAIIFLIGMSTVAVILSTVDWIYFSYSYIFYSFEIITVFTFTIEYIARVWSATESPEWSGIISGRLNYAVQPLLIVDLLAILPFYVMLARSGIDLRILRSLRLMRVFRMLKFARYSRSVRAFKHVFRQKYPDLFIALFANILLLVIASSMMYFIETGIQPDAFPSIPATMLWGISALTEADLAAGQPTTPLGQVLGAIVAALGIGLFALPASILASGFIREARSSDRTELTHCPHCGEEIKSAHDNEEIESRE